MTLPLALVVSEIGIVLTVVARDHTVSTSVLRNRRSSANVEEEIRTSNDSRREEIMKPHPLRSPSSIDQWLEMPAAC